MKGIGLSKSLYLNNSLCKEITTSSMALKTIILNNLTKMFISGPSWRGDAQIWHFSHSDPRV